MAIFTWMVETGVESRVRVSDNTCGRSLDLMSLFSLRSCHSFFSSLALAVLISLPRCSVSSLPFTIHHLNELPRVESPTPKPHSDHLQAHTQNQSSVLYLEQNTSPTFAPLSPHRQAQAWSFYIAIIQFTTHNTSTQAQSVSSDQLPSSFSLRDVRLLLFKFFFQQGSLPWRLEPL